jgi:hypothetical protein
MAILEHEFAPVSKPAYELRFQDLYRPGRGLSFPCDAEGRVAFGEMSEACRANYRRACDGIGTVYSVPTVQPLID